MALTAGGSTAGGDLSPAGAPGGGPIPGTLMTETPAYLTQENGFALLLS